MRRVFIFFYSIVMYFFKGLWIVLTMFPKYLFYGILVIIGKKDSIHMKFDKNFGSIIMLILSLVVYLTCVFFITRRFVQSERINVLSQWIVEDTEILIADESNNLDDGSELEVVIEEESDNYFVPSIEGTELKSADIHGQKQINSDTVAWIWVNGTNIDYPVVQTTNNSYYLSHDFYKNSYYSGWVYGDYRDNFNSFGRNTIIYAHNSLNGKMFSSLTKLLNNSWFSDINNKYIRLSTINTNSLWEIFSVYTIEPEVYYLTTGFTDESYGIFINTIAERSIYDFNTDVNVVDKVLTLQTCTNSGDKRVVVHAKLVRIEDR